MIFSGETPKALQKRRKVVMEGLFTPPSTKEMVWTETPAFCAKAFLESPAASRAARSACATAKLMRVISSSRSTLKPFNRISRGVVSRILETYLRLPALAAS